MYFAQGVDAWADHMNCSSFAAVVNNDCRLFAFFIHANVLCHIAHHEKPLDAKHCIQFHEGSNEDNLHSLDHARVFWRRLFKFSATFGLAQFLEV